MSSSARSAAVASRSWLPSDTSAGRLPELRLSPGRALALARFAGRAAASWARACGPTNRGGASAKRRPRAARFGRDEWRKRAAGSSQMSGLTAEERRAELVALYKEVQACTKCPLARDAHQGRVRGGRRRRRGDVRRRGAGRRRGPPGPALRRPRRAAAQPDARRDRALARGGLHRQRAEEPAARQPRPAAAGDRGLPSLPVRAGPPDRAEGRLHARQLRDQAAQRQPGRDHAGAGDAPGARARRSHRLPPAALPSRRRRCARRR